MSMTSSVLSALRRSSDNTCKFTGKEFDADSNLYYYGARYYDPYIGRFTQRDPAGDGVNWYAYTYNNPLKYTDPNGQEPVKDKVGTVDGFMEEFKESNPGSVELSDFMPGLPGLESRGNTGAIPKNNRYIYTQEWGWIDMQHFLSAAGTASFYIGDFLGFSNDYELRGHAQNYANALGYGVELAQFLTGNRSAFSYEDLPSNAAGAEFGAYGYDPNSELSLGEQIGNWLNDEAKAVDDPTQAPNYNLLPATFDPKNPPPDPPKNFGSCKNRVQSFPAGATLLSMDFPILDLIDNESVSDWLLNHFHPNGLTCPHCEASVEEARCFRQTATSQLPVYRCLVCDGIYNLYSSTVFQQKQLTPAQAVMLLRGIYQGTSSAQLTRELGLSRPTVHSIHRVIQANAQAIHPPTPVRDEQTETDEMFQNAGKKSDPPRDPSDPPRCRANQRKGRGTYANDRPPIVGTIGREPGQVRLRVVHHADKATLAASMRQFTELDAAVYTDEWTGYTGLHRCHATVYQGQRQWTRYADGIREVHTNTIEGVWTPVRNFLRPFRGVHKKLLAGYVAICEFRINLKRMTREFISKLVACTNS